MKTVNVMDLAKLLRKTPMTRKQMTEALSITLGDVARLLSNMSKSQRYGLVSDSEGIYQVTEIKRAGRGTPMLVRPRFGLEKRDYEQRTTRAPIFKG